MKTSFLTISMLFLFSVTTCIAQRSQDNGRTSFGILGGINMQNLNGKNANGDKLKNDMIMGYHAGINIQIPIAPEFYFQPGLLFSTKGAKNEDGAITSTYKLSYIELPLSFVYKGQLGGGYIMLGFGPYIGYGIMGKAKFEGGPASIESDIEFKNVVELSDPATTVYFKSLDAGGNIFAGYEMGGGLFVTLDTQFGMLKINPEDKRIPDNKTAVRNTGFGVSLGYRF